MHKNVEKLYIIVLILKGTFYVKNTNASQQNGFQGFNPPVHLITTTMSYGYNKTYLGEIDM